MNVLFVAPHPDDETLGCGGTILRHKAEGDDIHWLIVTDGRQFKNASADHVEARAAEVRSVCELFGFHSVIELGFPTAALDQVSTSQLIDAIADAYARISPIVVYVPWVGDAHSDHAMVFHAAVAASKWFRCDSVKRVLAYETLSETEVLSNPGVTFSPNVFLDVSGYLDEKIRIAKSYGTEIGLFPFPRSAEAIRALAQYRGATAGFEAAEAFVLLRERR